MSDIRTPAYPNMAAIRSSARHRVTDDRRDPQMFPGSHNAKLSVPVLSGENNGATMQEPAVIKRFHKPEGLCALEELDRLAPQLAVAGRDNVAAADASVGRMAF